MHSFFYGQRNLVLVASRNFNSPRLHYYPALICLAGKRLRQVKEVLPSSGVRQEKSFSQSIYASICHFLRNTTVEETPLLAAPVCSITCRRVSKSIVAVQGQTHPGKTKMNGFALII